MGNKSVALTTKPLIALFSGSFNPVHFGHVNLARNVIDNGHADEVWFSPSPQNPFKDISGLIPLEKRVQLLREATKDFRAFHVTDVERTLPVPSYTIDALHILKTQNPDKDFILLIGSDNIEKFTLWKSWNQIINEFGLLIYPRQGFPITDKICNIDIVKLQAGEKRHGGIFALPSLPLYDISSTQIRKTNPISSF